MSATAFQRRRRELEHKYIEQEETKNQIEKPLDKLTKDELRELLVSKGIEFDGKAKKDDLIELLQGED